MIHIDDVTILKGKRAFIDAAIQLILQTGRCLRIRSPMLDPELFDQPEFNEALSAFARKSRYAQVQILIDYPDQLAKEGHGTLNLMRRLSDKIVIKQFYDEPEASRDSYIVSDNRGILIKPSGHDSEGFFSLTDGAYTKNQREIFDHEWERSPIASELRSMIL